MGGSRIRIAAVLLVAFLAIGSQCVAFCEAQQASLPPCHQSDSSCAKAQTTGDIAVKQLKIELIAVAVVPVVHDVLPQAPTIAAIGHPFPSPPTQDATTVLRI
jgi:hypothetical protein